MWKTPTCGVRSVMSRIAFLFCLSSGSKPDVLCGSVRPPSQNVHVDRISCQNKSINDWRDKFLFYFSTLVKAKDIKPRKVLLLDYWHLERIWKEGTKSPNNLIICLNTPEYIDFTKILYSMITLFENHETNTYQGWDIWWKQNTLMLKRDSFMSFTV